MPRHRLLIVVLVVPCLGSLVLTACNEPPGINPWRDDSVTQDMWSTPSRDGVLASGATPVIRRSRLSPGIAPCVESPVPHYPLWWEDEFEDKGDGDLLFAWTYADYVAMPASYARWLLNTVGWPVSAVVTPPGTPMISDGQIGQYHDAERGRSPDPTAGPEDAHDLPAGS